MLPRTLRLVSEIGAWRRPHAHRRSALLSDGREDFSGYVADQGTEISCDELDTGQAAGDQGTQESEPAGAVLSRGDVQAEDLTVPVGVDADRDQRVDVDDPAALAGLLGQGVDPDERVRAGVKGLVAEGCDLLVQVFGHRTDLGIRQLGDPEGLGEFLGSAGGDAEGRPPRQPLAPQLALYRQPSRETSGPPARYRWRALAVVSTNSSGMASASTQQT